jgi:hypothetical protein
MSETDEEGAMIKTLVSIDPDLASSIALRYACQLSTVTGLDIQTLHVHGPSSTGLAMGSGWARRTWEKEMIAEGKKEISTLLVAESNCLRALKEPLVRPGDHDTEILKELEQGQYDLYVEGGPAPFTQKTLAKRLESRLYQHAPCPVLQVANLLPLSDALCIMRDDPGCRCAFTSLQRLFPSGRLQVDISLSSLRQAGDAALQEDAVRKLAGEFGWTIHNTREFQGGTETLAEEMKGYGLIVVAMDRPVKTRGPLVELLGELSLPSLFCWK